MSTARPVTSNDRKRLFIIGCPRSGTTWMQLLLAQHPQVATSQETHVFNNYLGALARCWAGEGERPLRRKTGLRSLLSEDEFYALCRDFATGVFEKIAEHNDACELIVEKSPDHIRSAELILRVFPDAFFLQVIRDPRSVVSSLRTAGRTWGRDWAPSSTAGCAARWVSDVRTGRAIAELTDRYREIQYEDLLARGVDELEAILEWLELPADRSFCEEAVERCRFEKLKKGSAEVEAPWALTNEPEGMYRRGAAEGWREDLSNADLKVIEHIAFDLMRRLGYEPAILSRRRKPMRLVARDQIKSLARVMSPVVVPALQRLRTLAED